MIVTSRVISPQYLIWLLATAAFCLLSRDTSQRRSALLILLALPLTQWIFPYNFKSLTHFHAGPILVLLVRDILLVGAAAIGFVDLWRDTVTGPFLPWRLRAAQAAESASQTEPEPTPEPVPDPHSASDPHPASEPAPVPEPEPQPELQPKLVVEPPAPTIEPTAGSSATSATGA
jgi:hypothetical protein